MSPAGLAPFARGVTGSATTSALTSTATITTAPAKHVDNSPFWAGEGIALVFSGIFVLFVVYVVVQRLRSGRQQKETDR